MKHLIQTCMLCIAMLFGNLFAYSTIRLCNHEIAFDSLPSKYQQEVKRITASFGDSISIDFNNGPLFRMINIYGKVTENRINKKIGSLNNKIKFLKENNVNENDTNSINNAVVETDKYCKKVFVEAGYPENSLYSLKPEQLTKKGWLFDLKNLSTHENVSINFEEYYNGIKIYGDSQANIEFKYGKIRLIHLHAYASPNVTIHGTKPLISMNQAIESYRNKKHLSQAVKIKPYSLFCKIIQQEGSKNILIDSLSLIDLVYIPDKTDYILTLSWMIQVEFGKTVWVDAVTGEVIREYTGVFQ